MSHCFPHCVGEGAGLRADSAAEVCVGIGALNESHTPLSVQSLDAAPGVLPEVTVFAVKRWPL